MINSPRRRGLVVALIAAVVLLDQALKWWAWRHLPWTTINSGGDALVGQRIGSLYAGPVTGALLDLLDFGLVSIAVWGLTRCRVSAAVSVPGALMVGGWGSNLLDRLGIHYWTAPDSVRGAVDFILIDAHYYNIADFFIIGCTPLFLLGVGYQGVRAAMRPAAGRSVPPPARSNARVRVGVRARMRIPALAGAGLILVVAFGAVNYGGVSAASIAPMGQNDGLLTGTSGGLPHGLGRCRGGRRGCARHIVCGRRTRRPGGPESTT